MSLAWKLNFSYLLGIFITILDTADSELDSNLLRS